MSSQKLGSSISLECLAIDKAHLLEAEFILFCLSLSSVSSLTGLHTLDGYRMFSNLVSSCRTLAGKELCCRSYRGPFYQYKLKLQYFVFLNNPRDFIGPVTLLSSYRVAARMPFAIGFSNWWKLHA